MDETIENLEKRNHRLISIFVFNLLFLFSVFIIQPDTIYAETIDLNIVEGENTETDKELNSNKNKNNNTIDFEDQLLIDADTEESNTELIYNINDSDNDIQNNETDINETDEVEILNMTEDNEEENSEEKLSDDLDVHNKDNNSNTDNQKSIILNKKITNEELRNGLTDEEVIQLKKDLTKLKFGGMNINATYGNFTVERVKQFQEYYGLPVSGKATKETLNLIKDILSNNFQLGKKHKDVVKLKEKLIELGYGGMNLNETYGSFTAKRVQELQSDYGLIDHGIVDYKTEQKIEELLKTPIKQGDRMKRVIPLKKKLTRLGFGGMNINEHFGSFTSKRVKQFQNYYGLNETGIADVMTFEKLNEILSTPFQVGKRSESVIEIKENLTILGYGNMNLNDVYGSFTEKRVKQFQKDHGLRQNGIVDEVTYNKIESLFNSIYETGKRHQSIITLKQYLTKFGFGGMNINELYGSYTAKRMKEFQTYYDLPATGTMNKETKKILIELITTPLQEGKKNRQVIDLKENLVKLGFGGMNINETYGSFTTKKVKQLQKYYGLVVNGIADKNTLKKIDEILNGIYRLNNRHPDIIELKEKLTRLEFGGMNINETYGSFTIKRVKEFQQYYGLVVNGIADEPTLKKIDAVLSSPFQLNQRHQDILIIKELLNRAGFGGMNMNELYGSFTEKQVKKFQQQFNLKPHGIVDDVTYRKLNEIASRVIKIFIDPGHGGHDPGAVSNGVREKDLNLAIAKKLKKELEKYNNVVIKMSRTSDKFLSLSERSEMANNWGADFFLSIHINAGGGTGIESYIYLKPTKEEIKKQQIIHDHIATGLSKDKIKDRGKKQANYHVVRETNMTAMLIEYLFIDTAKDRNKLTNNSFQNKLARLTAEGIAKAFNLKKK